ncbi:MAG: alpha/beta hydrolase [Actinomycetota bacterium]|nr:alpha/beta hydrolase [Actinomycetota bacterium]
MARWLRRLLAVAVVVVLAAVAWGGWYYSGEILIPEPPARPVFETRVEAVAGNRVTLEATEQARRSGLWGLDFASGYGLVGTIVDEGDDTVTRRYTPMDGRPRAGQEARIDSYAFPEDGAAAGLDFPVNEVSVPGPLGRYPAWLATPATGGRTWAVLVHGRAAQRNECFRLLPTLHEAGLSSLCTSYRNDEGAPAAPNGLYGLGATEWADLDAAVGYVRALGARRVVLVGYSMGAQVVTTFLRRSERANLISGVILDAPVLDWGPVLGLAADERGVSRMIVPLGMFASELRGGIDFDDLDQIEAAEDFDVPILLFHGTADTTVPVSTSDEFAATRPDLVTYERVAGAGHVQAYNTNPHRYTEAVEGFLADNRLGALVKQRRTAPAG